jgi:7,8-dihydropterin-6-yl-methyl-4-(beta-D-ribofuranosyl)aminobenzene 5'-phosphate synthase
MDNMDKLRVAPGRIEGIFLSHAHEDHTAGLSGVRGANPKLKVYLGRSFPKSLKDAVRARGAELVEIDGPTEIEEDIYSTGELGTGIKEQSLIIKTKKGLVVITGCAHPGIVKITRSAKEQLHEEIYLLLGGFHLSGMSDSQVNSIIGSLKELGVKKAAPCHCTGDRAIELFEKAYKEDFIANGVGNIIEV